jgi:hypothetical protein
MPPYDRFRSNKDLYRLGKVSIIAYLDEDISCLKVEPASRVDKSRL